MLTTDQKGSIAETAITAAAARLGIGVYRPITDGERYDLIFDLRPRLLRVQCKTASRPTAETPAGATSCRYGSSPASGPSICGFFRRETASDER